MARTINEIYDSIVTEKETFASLDGLEPAGDNAQNLLAELNSGSRVAVWKLWAYVQAFVVWTLEKMWDLKKAELEELAAQSVYGTVPWLVGKAKEWQFGDPLLFDENYNAFYASIDEAKRLIKFASVQQVGKVAVVKVAADDGSGLPQALTTAQLDSFKGYLNDIQPAGASVTARSNSSDLVKLDAVVYFDANFAQSAIESAVLDAIKSYVQELDFSGTLYKNQLIDAVQAVDGVLDIIINGLEGMQVGGSYTAFNRSYASFAGHVQLDVASSTLTYQAE